MTPQFTGVQAHMPHVGGYSSILYMAAIEKGSVVYYVVLKQGFRVRL